MILSRSDRSNLAIWLWTIDRWLFLSFLTLLFLGIIFTLTSSSTIAIKLELDSYHFSIRHSIFVVLSLISAVLLSRLNTEKIKIFSFICFVIILLILLYCTESSVDAPVDAPVPSRPYRFRATRSSSSGRRTLSEV